MWQKESKGRPKYCGFLPILAQWRISNKNVRHRCGVGRAPLLAVQTDRSAPTSWPVEKDGRRMLWLSHLGAGFELEPPQPATSALKRRRRARREVESVRLASTVNHRLTRSPVPTAPLLVPARTSMHAGMSSAAHTLNSCPLCVSLSDPMAISWGLGRPNFPQLDNTHWRCRGSRSSSHQRSSRLEPTRRRVRFQCLHPFDAGGAHDVVRRQLHARTTCHRGVSRSSTPSRSRSARGGTQRQTLRRRDVPVRSPAHARSATTHQTPRPLIKAPLNIGVADPVRAPYLPIYTLRNFSTQESVQTTDPGRAMISGKWRTSESSRVPSCVRWRHARLFPQWRCRHAREVVEFYDTRFNIA